MPGRAERGSPRRIIEHRAERPSQIGWIVRRVQQPGRTVEQFGERAVIRRHHGHSRRHGLDHRQPFRLRVRRRHREHIAPFEQPEFARPIHLPEPGEAIGHAEVGREPTALGEIRGLGTACRPGGHEFHVVRYRERRDRPNQLIEPLLGAQPRQRPDHVSASPPGPPRGEIGRPGWKARKIDAVPHDRDLFRRHSEIVGHEAGEEVIERHEVVDVAASLPQESANLAVVRLRNLLDEDVFARQAADDLRARGILHAPRQADQKRVRQVHHVGLHLGRQPAGELLDLLALVPCLAGECGHGEAAEISGLRVARAAREPREQASAVEQVVEPPGRVAKQRHVLLQPHVHAATHDPWFGDVFLVGRGRHVGRHEDRIAAARPQGPHERVVVEAGTTDPPSRSGRDLDDFHAKVADAAQAPPRPSKWTSTSARSAGVIPLTRPACSSVRGRTRSSFSRASARRCRTAA